MSAIARIALGLGAAGLLSGCMASQGTQQIVSWNDRPASAEALYLKRLEAIQGRAAAQYDPVATIPGADPVSAKLPAVVTGTIEASAIEAAAQYASDSASSALLIWHKGNLVAERYFGDAKANTELNSKSLSKPLTAIAVGRAIALGHIESLDQPIADFVTEWKGTPKAVMTIRHALSMHSGLLEQGFDMSTDSPFPRAYLDPYHGQYIVDEYPLTDTPGTRFAYANAASDLMALLIERATGRDYEEFVGNEIFRPIKAPGGKVWINREGGLAHSGCCMEVPAQTWLKLGALLVNDGKHGDARLLPKGFVKEVQKPSPDNPHYGLGVWLGSPYLEKRGFLGTKSNPTGVYHSEPYLAEDLYLFDGNGNQVIYLIPSEDLVILRMGGGAPKDVTWDNSMLANTILRGIKR
ncbi:MAG: serine hydrolase domain-containing protein [Erythrobacter sp.]